MILRRIKAPVNEIMDDFIFPERNRNVYSVSRHCKKHSRKKNFVLPLLSLIHLVQQLFHLPWDSDHHLHPYHRLQRKLKLRNAYASVRRNVFKDPRYNYEAYIDQFDDVDDYYYSNTYMLGTTIKHTNCVPNTIPAMIPLSETQTRVIWSVGPSEKLHIFTARKWNFTLCEQKNVPLSLDI